MNGPASELLQRLAQLRLKQNHQHHSAVIDHIEQHPVERRQAQKIAYPAGHHQCDQALENGAGARFLGDPVLKAANSLCTSLTIVVFPVHFLLCMLL